MPNQSSLRLPADLEDVLRRATWLYPQPVAMACGSVLRCRSAQERLDALLRAGEVLARYLAVVGMASYAARPQDAASPDSPPATKGPIAFGHFIAMAQFVARCRAEHPLIAELAAGFRVKKGEGPTGDALLGLLQIRNELGHQLQNLTGLQAAAILTNQDPARLLVSALRGVDRLLGLPLLVVEEQQVADEAALVARMLYLMGETADPEPWQLQISEPFGKNRAVYIATPAGMLRLHPLLLWEVAEAQHNYGLFILDSVEADRVVYKPMSASTLERRDEVASRVATLLGGSTVPLENVVQYGGSAIVEHWRNEAERLRAAAQHREGHVPWRELDDATVRWYATLLDPDVGPANPQSVVTEKLLDGREQFRPEEISQVVLLFGRDANVRARLGREMIDLRVTGVPGTRWTERLESHANVLSSLRQAVEFLARNVGVAGVTLDGLRATVGSADYVAIREALINLFIHQDYGDPSAAAQVEVAPERTLFFNTGKSLVSAASLLEGGKSQARNPLIARALRLIGFAELAGSGLRELQRVWRGTQRRPPRMDSNSAANTFSLTLDWRSVPDVYDRVWRSRIGVRLTPEQSTILNLALDPAGIGPEEAASATGLELDAARKALEFLNLQVLVEEQRGRYHVRPHLRELVEPERSDPGEPT